MDNQQWWTEVVEIMKNLKAGLIGLVGLITAVVSFVLLLQGHQQLGITILIILVVAVLLIIFSAIFAVKKGVGYECRY